jgi:hypothetical protein
MKTRMILALVAVLFAGFSLGFAADPHMGTWKLNEAKSTLNPEASKFTTSVYAPAGDRVKITLDGFDKDGKPVHNEWTGKFDGKDYPVTGDPRSDMLSYRKIDDHTLELTVKKGRQRGHGRFHRDLGRR